MALGLFEELKLPLTETEALIEADRCLECGSAHAPAPCVVACPADVDVSAFVGDVAQGDDAGAARTIFEENLLGGTCGRVCPVEVRKVWNCASVENWPFLAVASACWT